MHGQRAMQSVMGDKGCTCTHADTMQALSTQYDPDASERFFSQRPLLVWRRLGEVTARVAGLYLRAFLRGSRTPASDDLCALLATLGPTFVKLGQTLSTREDLIGRDLARTLSNLQMSAPPFDDAIAFSVIRDELHGDPRHLYQRFPETHAAAASLGQVYQAELHNLENSSEDLVAVKVQRPDLLGSIALDVYALRLGLAAVRRVAKINSDLRKIADEVGAGLFAELDYRVEASQVRPPPRVRQLCVEAVLRQWRRPMRPRRRSFSRARTRICRTSTRWTS